MDTTSNDVNRITKIAARVANVEAAATAAIKQAVEQTLEMPELTTTTESEVQAWASRKRMLVNILSARVREIHAATETELEHLLPQVLMEAYQMGVQSAARIGAELKPDTPIAPVTEKKGPSGGFTILEETQRSHRLMATRVPYLFRQAITAALAPAVAGATTRVQAVQTVMDQMVKVDRTATRRGAMRTASYLEMATRSLMMAAHIDGYVTELDARGIDLVRVSDSPEECPACRKWERRVLSLKPGHPKYPSMADAEKDGLFHPGCTHRVVGYVHGVSRSPKPAVPNPSGYADRQKLRELERRVRAAREEAQFAADPAVKERALKRVAVNVTRIEALTSKRGGPARRKDRESITRPR